MKSHSGKAQASYELVLLIAFVVMLSVLISSYFVADAEKSRIEAGAKSALLEGLNNSEKFYFIQTVEFNSADSALEICLNPALPEAAELATLKAAISKRTNVAVASIHFGFVPDYGFCYGFPS